jgi:hypothetical protein
VEVSSAELNHRGRDEYFQYITAVQSTARRLSITFACERPIGRFPAQAQHASLPGGIVLVDMIDIADGTLDLQPRP